MADPLWRLGAGFVVAAGLVYAATQYLAEVPGLNDPAARFNLGLYVLAGLPFFYLLTFVAQAEESEGEIMAVCAGLGVALNLMDFARAAPNMGSAGFLLPITAYFVYATRVLPGLRVFKHTVRGFSYLNLGRLRESLYFFNRALKIDPKNALAAQGMTALHRGLTLDRLQADPGLAEQLDFTLCLDRAAGLLLHGRVPTPAQREEADRFLELVERQKPAMQARVDYLRAVSQTHAREYDTAAGTLGKLLDPETSAYQPAVRRAVLFPAWDLALRLHPQLVERLGTNELAKPGRRVEAIGAVERQLAAAPEDSAALELKANLYSGLVEAEFVAAAADGPPEWFNYDYVEQLGLALADDPDPERRDRGMAYLRVAGRGLADRGPAIFRKLADVAEKAGDLEATRGYLEQVKRTGYAALRDRRLAPDQKEIYLASLQKLAAAAELREDYEAAIDDLRFYLDAGGKQELQTYRRLADLYGKNKDALNGLLMVETGLTYVGTDSELLKKKDTFYYSVTPEQVEAKKDRIGRWFDARYCARKAAEILNMKDGDADLLDWATHLATLAKIMQPGSAAVRLVEARCRLRRGERDEGLRMLEDLREGKKGSGDDEEAWYTATKLLGDMYLDELNQPDLAIACYTDFKESNKSGADTLFKLARAYEAKGDIKNALRFYEAVTAYESHPLRWEAEAAIRRLKGES